MGKTRDFEIDVLKGLACITVVLIHVYRGNGAADVFVGEAGRWAVPAFFMTQGLYIRGSALKNWGQMAAGKVKKIYMPFLACSLLYGLYFYIYDGKEFTAMDVLLGETAVHLYYIVHYMIFALTLTFIYRLPKRGMHALLWFMVLSNFVLCTVLEIQKLYGIRIIRYSGINPLKWWGFVAIGILVSEFPHVMELVKRNWKASAAISLFFAASATALQYASSRIGYMYNRAGIFPLAIGVCVFIVAVFQYEKIPGKKFLTYISSRSFGIYLVHFWVVHMLKYPLGIKSKWIVAIAAIALSSAMVEISRIIRKRIADTELI